MAEGVTRRRLLATSALVLPVLLARSGAAAIIRGDVPWAEGRAANPQAADTGAAYHFLTAPEVAFIEAAVDRLIPADELGPGALAAGVPTFIDRQLAGEYGQAAHWYMQGPWDKGLPTQGYQTRLTPAQFYRSAIAAIDAAMARAQGGRSFAALGPEQRDAVLKQLEAGELDLQSVDGKAFFQMLHQNTLEGFFADPIYAGNRDMAGWRLIGFMGARYDNRPFVTRFGEPYPLPPVGIAGRPDWNGG
jgi:gluconate 2-dehydrogenase gamma chain